MKIEQVAVEGAVLTVYLRQPAEAMPLAATRPLVLVAPGGGYEHVSAREADPWRSVFWRRGTTRRCWNTA